MGASETLEIVIKATGADQAEKALVGLGNVLGGLGKFALGAAGAGLAALGAGLAFSIREAMGAQEVMAQTEAVLKSTGGAAGVSATQIADWASALGNSTRFGDEAVQSGENILLTFTNIGKNVFPEATTAMVDLSQAMGQDIKSSAVQLGKALNDPVQGMTALQRVGVTFTDSQKKLVEQLVKTGKTEEAQKLILAELNKEFGGSAKAAGQTLSGQLDRLKNALGNVGEAVGNQLLPYMQRFMDEAVMPFVNQYGPLLAQWVGENLPIAAATLAQFWTTTLQPALTQVWAWLQTNLFPVLQQLWTWLAANLPVAIQALSTWWTTTLAPALMATGAWLNANVLPHLRTLWQWLQENLPRAIATLSGFWNNTLYPAISKVWNWVSSTAIPKAKELAIAVGTTLGQAVQTLTKFWNDTLMPALSRVWGYINTNILPVFRTAGEIAGGLGQIISNLAGKFSSVLFSAVSGAALQLSGPFKSAMSGVSNFISGTLGPALSGLKLLAEGALNFLSGAFTAGLGALQNLLQRIKDLIEWILGHPIDPTPFPGCFTYATPITLADGSVREIGMVQVDDKVLAWNENERKFEPGMVVKKLHHPAKPVYELSTSGRRIYTTREHRFLTDKGWKAAGELRPGDWLKTAGRFVEVLGGQDGERADVFNLEIRPQHTYVAAGVVVHNAKGPSPAGATMNLAAGAGRNIVNSYNLTIYSNAGSENLAADFNMMKAWGA
jgi:phage-related protein